MKGRRICSPAFVIIWEMGKLDFGMFLHAPNLDIHIMQAVCPNCNVSISSENMVCSHCGLILHGANPTSPVSFEKKYRNALLATMSALLMSAALTWLGLRWERRHEMELARLAQEHQGKVAATLRALRIKYPTTSFARYAENTGPFRMDASLKQCKVRTLAITRNEGTLTVTVGVIGSRTEPQAPVVWVAAYDGEGQLLGRGCIVKFENAELERGQTREVEDTMEIPRTSHPDIISVDEGGS